MPARKPRTLKLLQNTLTPARDKPELELGTIGIAGLAAPPEWLSKAGQVEYMRVGAILAGAGVLTAADESLLTAYAGAWSQLVRMWENDIAPKAADLTAFRLLANDLGLSPRARASLPPGKQQTANRFANNVMPKSADTATKVR